MNKKRPRRHVRPLAWLRSQGVWFWAIAVTATSVFVLWAGSQIAHDRGQSVEWYTGFGQWLGGLGSLTAAVVALWIATRDRRERARERRSEEKIHARLVRLYRPWCPSAGTRRGGGGSGHPLRHEQPARGGTFPRPPVSPTSRLPILVALTGLSSTSCLPWFASRRVDHRHPVAGL